MPHPTSLSGISLEAVTATGPGIAIFSEVPHTIMSVQASYTGSPSNFTISVECTLDGMQWVPVGSINLFSATSLAGVSNLPPFLGLRANLVTLTGGTSPTVTAWIAAA